MAALGDREARLTMAMYQTLAKVMTTDAKLKLRCEACEHTAEWDRRSAWTIFGADATPYTIRRRAKCIVCGERGRIGVSIS